MNKIINKLLKEMKEYRVVIPKEQRGYVKSILKSAYQEGKVEGMKEIQKIYKK